MPNLLFIFTDEQRFDTLAAYGNSRITMPKLNRLAERSCVFERAYVTQAACTPSRASLMTGLWPHTSGCMKNNDPLPAGVQCLPEMLRGGYVTGYHGKWHLGDEIFAQHGFGDWRSLEDLYTPYYSAGRDRAARSTYHHWLTAQGVTPARGEYFSREETCRLAEPLTKPAYLAGEARRFIRENKDKPFVLCVNFLEPHMPFFGPRDGQYAPADTPLPPNFDALPAENQPLKARLFQQAYYDRGHSGLTLQTDDQWRRLIANYWGLCSLVDTYVGAILDQLDACGLAEDTIVVFTSDHGDMMGSHRLLAKCVQFEEAARVPMLIRVRGQQTQRRIVAPVSQIDLLPTLLDLMGQPIPGHLQGRSLRPAMETGSSPGRDVFMEWNGPNTGIIGEAAGRIIVPGRFENSVTPQEAEQAACDPVRTVVTPDLWKLNVSPTRGEHELYHLASDPHERRNVVAENKALTNKLLDRLRGWQDQTRDTVELPRRL